MPVSDALELTNVFPELSWVELRRGYQQHVTGLPASVETLMSYAGATSAMFAASNGAIYDVTSAGAVGAAVVSGLNNARLQWLNFSNTGGTYLVWVNGADGVQTWDGTTWATQVITGVGADELFCIASWKRRLWFGQQGTSSVWYLGADAIAGAATELNLGGVWRLGGQIAGILTTSFETSGTGLADYIGFMSTEGELAVYNGTDPDDATAFALVGVYRLGSPIGDRFYAPVAGDMGLLTSDGLVSMMRAMQIDRSVSAQASITDKIARLFTDAFQLYGTQFGWSVTVYPEGHRVLVNIPINSTTAIQYVMNTLSGAWCQYTNHNAASWVVHDGGLYFGGLDGTVYRADYGTSDNGDGIEYTIKTAFSDYKQGGRLKRFTLLRPLIQANANPRASIIVNVDYGDDNSTNIPVITAFSGVWDSALWDDATWSAGLSVLRPWVSVGGTGYVASVLMEGSAIGLTMTLSAFDVVFEPASALGL